jgi:hypothetical protein
VFTNETDPPSGDCLGLLVGGNSVPMFSLLGVPNPQNEGWTMQFFDDPDCIEAQGDPIRHCGAFCVTPTRGESALSARVLKDTSLVSQTLPISTNSLEVLVSEIMADKWELFGRLC